MKIIVRVLILLLVLVAAAVSMAAPAVLYLRANDLQPYYYAQIIDSSGDAVDLTGASAVFTMKEQDGSIKVNRQSAVITNATSGLLEYRWQTGNTNAAGAYYIEFEVTPASGGKFTVPDRTTKAKVVIEQDLDSQ